MMNMQYLKSYRSRFILEDGGREEREILNA